MSGSLRELSLEKNDMMIGTISLLFAPFVFNLLLLANIAVLDTCFALTSVNLESSGELTGQ